MQISSENVWSGYVLLHRYAIAVGISAESRVKLPRTLARHIPPPLQPAGVEGAKILSDLDKNFPVPFGPTYYAYLYLFRQLIRLSFKAGPYYLNSEQGWRNLAWYPLKTLLGNKDKGTREWQSFYNLHIRGKQPRPTQADFYMLYPPLEAEELFQFKIADRQIDHLFLASDARKIKTFTILLEDNHTAAWHSWFYFACPQFWSNVDLLQSRLPQFGKLLKDQRAWKVFVHQFLPQFLKNVKDLRTYKRRLAEAIDTVLLGQSQAARTMWNRYASKELLS